MEDKKNILTYRTKNGMVACRGVYMFYSTYGLPLEDIFQELKKNDLVPDIDNIEEEAKREKVNWNHFSSMLKGAVLEVYGKEKSDILLSHLG